MFPPPKQISQDQIKANIESPTTLKWLYDLYISPLKEPNVEVYLLRPFADMCSGWDHETFQRIITQKTMKNTIPLPMAFISPQQMTMISNKQEPV